MVSLIAFGIWFDFLYDSSLGGFYSMCEYFFVLHFFFFFCGLFVLLII